MMKTKFKPGDKFILEIGKKRIALDEWAIARTDLWVRTYLLEKLTPYKPEEESEQKLAKIKDLIEGTIDHFDRDDAMDLLYQIKDVLKMR